MLTTALWEGILLNHSPRWIICFTSFLHKINITVTIFAARTSSNGLLVVSEIFTNRVLFIRSLFLHDTQRQMANREANNL